jgi:RNA 2',3'-cyclic 3'-phosphodiesterase
MAWRRRDPEDDPVEAHVVDDDAEPRRCFVGVRPPEGVIAAIERRVDDLRRQLPGVRWVPPEQWHITLKFLGDVPDVHGVARALRDLSQLEPFPVRLGGGGAFPSWPNARTVWVGVERGSPRLARAARSVDMLLDDIEVRRAVQRPFLPHLTIARASPSTDARLFLTHLGTASFGAVFDVEEITLFQSQPIAGGRRYVPLAVSPLIGRFL